jgi:hypothetical protein
MDSIRRTLSLVKPRVSMPTRKGSFFRRLETPQVCLGKLKFNNKSKKGKT